MSPGIGLLIRFQENLFGLLSHRAVLEEALKVRTKKRRKRVVEVLERVARTHGLPQVITMDNGTEFTCRAVHEWVHRNGVKLDFI